MKRFFNFRRAFAAVASLSLIFSFGCSEFEATTPEKTEEFVVTKSVEYNAMTVTVTPPSSAKTYFARPFTQRAIPADMDDKTLQTFIISEPDFDATCYEGMQVIPFGGLIGDSNYELVYFGYDPAKKVATTPLYREKFRTPEAPQMYDIEILENDALYSKVRVTPSDNDEYYSFIIKKSVYDKNGGDDYGMILAEIGYWNSMAEQLKEYGLDYTWLEVYWEDELVSAGTREFYNYEIGSEILWGTDYVAYAFSIDQQGNIANHMNKVFYTTPGPTPSQNTFTCNIEKAWVDGVRATITPSNDDPYFVSVENYDRFVSFYENPENGFTYDDMLIRIMEGYTPTYINGKIFTGQTTIDTRTNLLDETQLFPVKTPNSNYAIVVVGFENGPTTGYNFFKFRSEGTLEE